MHVTVKCSDGSEVEYDVNVASTGRTRDELVAAYASILAGEKNEFDNYQFRQTLGTNHDIVFNSQQLISIDCTGV